MLKSEIKYLSRQMNLNIRDHPYLKLHGKRGKWYFKDRRTFYENEIPHVYPIGISRHSIYVINPFTGEITSHGFNGTDGYMGHKSQGYIVESIYHYGSFYPGVMAIKDKMQSLIKYNEKYKIYERRWN